MRDTSSTSSTPRPTRREALHQALRLLGGSLALGDLAPPALATLLAACERDPARATTPGSTGLRAEQTALLASIADHVIPRTDTPGASDVGVPAFIAAMLADAYSADERTAFLRGLDDVDARARRAHGRAFVACTSAERVAVLAALDTEAYRKAPHAVTPRQIAGEARAAAQPGAGATPLPPDLSATPADTAPWVWGESRTSAAAPGFWRAMKQLTLVGYYTSQAGATKELRYEPVPGSYDGCVPLATVGRTWAV